MPFLYTTELTYAAPATNISIVFALMKLDSVVTKRIVAMMVTIIRDVTSVRALQMITGTSSSVITSNAVRVRAISEGNEVEKMNTRGSREKVLQWYYLSS